MARRKQSGGTPATTALATAGVEFRMHEYAHDARAASYGEEAAEAMGIDPGQVFKTLFADVDGALVVAVVPVSGQLDLKALARSVDGRKAVMADPKAAERATGYVVGGISPLGQRKAHPTVIDDTALTHDTVFVSAGRRGLEVELSPAELVRLTAARVAPIRR
ncbi:Cys-tRNA(Pro) deacylase [Nocardioides sp. LHD-245]|uniref:Cys-tRNA(Pro) deacylase n=1 Tax=Nocardioides sp. LHD-245 TaxID=3051387 RepID=UPI0027DF844D|nr:Cys-tRNA(Pro) deacylase [Nocardioides sp. LHD-245]